MPNHDYALLASRALTCCAVSSQWLIGSMRVVVALGMVLLVAQLILKSVKNDSNFFRRRHFAVMNVVLASEWLACCVTPGMCPCALVPWSMSHCDACALCTCRFVSVGHECSQCGVHPAHVAGPQTAVVQAAVAAGCHPLCDAEHPGTCTWSARPPEQVLCVLQQMETGLDCNSITLTTSQSTAEWAFEWR
jgi:hypothetical protein